MKKIASVVLTVVVLCTMLSFGVLAEQSNGDWLDSVDFSKDNKAVYVASAGEITATANISTAAPSGAVMVTAVYNDSSKQALTNVSYNTISGLTGSVNASPVTVTSASEVVCVYFFGNASLGSLAKSEKLDNVSRDTRISALSVNFGGTDYNGYTNTATKATTFYVDKTIADADKENVAVAATVASGARVENVDFTATNPTVTVVAAQGNTKKYPVSLCDGLNTYWDEKWTGAGITDGDCCYEEYDYPYAFVPTYGTWGNGIEDEEMKKGYWDTNKENTATVFAIENNLSDAVTGEGNTNTALSATVSAEKHKRFIMRPNYTLNTAIYSVDYMQSADNLPRIKLFMGGVYFMLETSGKIDFRSENRGVVGSIPGKYVTTGQWHNMTLIQKRNSADTSKAFVELYVDKQYIGSCTMNTYLGDAGEDTRYCALSNAQAFAFSGLTGKGKVYFDNNKILGLAQQ